MASAGEVEVKVLGVWPSPFAITVRVALNLKGASYEYVEGDLVDKSELLLESNPVHKKVPVLIHKGTPVSESLVIVQYIDEAWAGTGPVILPTDPYERAVARFWAAFIHETVASAWRRIAKARIEEERTEAVKQAMSALDTFEEAFKACSKGKAFFGGDTIGYVDAVLGGFLGWFDAIDKIVGTKLIDAARTPFLAAWAESFRAADAAKDVVPADADKVLEYFRALQPRWPDAPGN